jgi:hypothetical protein
MNKYNIYVIIGRETAMGISSESVFANYFESKDGSHYFYQDSGSKIEEDILVAVYPVNRTVIYSIEKDAQS